MAQRHGFSTILSYVFLVVRIRTIIIVIEDVHFIIYFNGVKLFSEALKPASGVASRVHTILDQQIFLRARLISLEQRVATYYINASCKLLSLQ